jgi:hypothetical protein
MVRARPQSRSTALSWSVHRVPFAVDEPIVGPRTGAATEAHGHRNQSAAATENNYRVVVQRSVARRRVALNDHSTY